jgi:3-isopropylmalate dehydratase small subunit
VAPGRVLKIVPATDEIWNTCLHEGLIDIFKSAGALFGNAGCAGCASGQIGQNGPGEKTVSTGNRNFEGKQGKGEVFLASVSTAAASAVAGHITSADDIPEHPSLFFMSARERKPVTIPVQNLPEKEVVIEGKVWLVLQDNVDTDMIFHNRHLAITDIQEMGKYTFGNLQGWENYARQSEPGDIVVTGKNFGSGSSRQQAVDCFKALQNRAILAKSFGAIYERNAINAGFPVLTYTDISKLELENRDSVVIDLQKGSILNKRNNRQVNINPFSEVQMMIYKTGDLLLL